MGLLTLIARLGLDTSGFDAGLNRSQSSASRFASRIRGSVGTALAGAFSVGALTALTKQTINYASHMRDLADRLGVNVEWLQQMQFAAVQAGASVDDLAGFMEKLAVARGQAVGNPQGKTANAFKQFGIGAEALKTSPLQALVDQIGKAFTTGNAQALIPALREVGGRGAGALTAAFTQGIEQGRQAAQAAGAVMSEELVDQLDEIDDGFARLAIQLKVGIAPAIIAVGNAISFLVNSTKQFGAMLGGASAQKLSSKEIGLGILSPMALILKRLTSKEAVQAVMSEAGDQLNAADAAELSRRNMREARRRRTLAPTEFESLQPLKSRAEKTELLQIFDPLRRIGAFSQGTDTGFKLVSLQERIARATERTAENTGEGPL